MSLPLRDRGIAFDSLINAVAGLLGRGFSFVAFSVLVGHLFGANLNTDAFMLGALIPLWLQQSIVYGLHSCFLPLVAAEVGEDAAARLAIAFARRSLVWLWAVTLILIAAASPLVGLASGSGAANDASDYARAMFALVAIGYPGAVLAAYFYGRRRYLVPALGQVGSGVGLIAGLALFHRPFGLWSLVCGFAIGVVLQIGLMLAIAGPERAALWRALRAGESDSRVAQVFGLLAPIGVGTVIFPIFLIATRVAAGAVGEGAITALDFASRAVVALSGLLGSAVALSAVPRLSVADPDPASRGRHLASSVRALAFLLVPAGVTLGLFAEIFVDVVYRHGQFGAASARLVSAALVPLAVGLLLEPINSALMPMLVSRQRTWRLLACTSSGLVVGLALLDPLTRVHGITGISWAMVAGQLTQVLALGIALFALRDPLSTALPPYLHALAAVVPAAFLLHWARVPALAAIRAGALPPGAALLAMVLAASSFVLLFRWLSLRSLRDVR